MKSGKFIKIQDGTIIRKDSLEGWRASKYDPKGCHCYIAMLNKKTGNYDMYPTSHYVDLSKQTDVRKGRAILMNIKGMRGLSTVYKQPRRKDVHGQRFKEDFKKYESIGFLTPSQMKRFKKFIK